MYKTKKMIRRIPKKYRQKYAQQRGVDTELLVFAFKVVGPVALFFMAAIGLDVYSLLK